MRVRTVGLLALLALVIASCGGSAPEAAGPSEGIQVHGDWTIDIYNEDGTLDQSVEFENALVEPGGDALIQLLLGAGPVDGQSWAIALSNACPTGCLITDVTATGVNTGGSVNLSDALELQGAVVATTTATIDTVSTRFGYCISDETASQCQTSLNPGELNAPFTRKTLDPADQVEVDAGQTINVQVIISFTSG